VNQPKKCLIVGASGLVGSAAVAEFARRGWAIVAAARRPPLMPGVEPLAVDLLDERACRRLVAGLTGVTHLVYTALHERPALVAGWSDAAQIDANDRMFRNVLNPLVDSSTALRHVTLLQGAKAYGVHVRAMPIPAREDRDELRSAPNFYWRQEERLRATAESRGFGWTILRPVLIVGAAFGGAMNVAAAIGVFAALLRAEGLPLAFPGGAPRIGQAIDADLLARAIAWAGESGTARNQVFNVTNGDVFVWENVWPAIADCLGMPTADRQPRSLVAFCNERADLWDRIRRRYDLLSPALDAFAGASLQYCDYAMRHGQAEPGPAAIVSTARIRAAGFGDGMDTEEMFRKVFRTLQERRMLPPP
jgi:nucleoside-diphosphate-sugar epimerase